MRSKNFLWISILVFLSIVFVFQISRLRSLEGSRIHTNVLEDDEAVFVPDVASTLSRPPPSHAQSPPSSPSVARSAVPHTASAAHATAPRVAPVKPGLFAFQKYMPKDETASTTAAESSEFTDSYSPSYVDKFPTAPEPASRQVPPTTSTSSSQLTSAPPASHPSYSQFSQQPAPQPQPALTSMGISEVDSIPESVACIKNGIIAIMSGKDFAPQRLGSILDTWGANIKPRLVLYTDAPGNDTFWVGLRQQGYHTHHLPADHFACAANTRHFGAWSTLPFLEFVWDEYFEVDEELTYALFIDDDTYLFSENFCTFVERHKDKYNFKHDLYGGFSLYVTSQAGDTRVAPQLTYTFPQGGAGYLMSRSVLHRIRPYIDVCEKNTTGVFGADLRIWWCLFDYANDVTMNMLTNNEFRRENMDDGETNNVRMRGSQDLIMSFHHVSPREMRDLHTHVVLKATQPITFQYFYTLWDPFKDQYSKYDRSKCPGNVGIFVLSSKQRAHTWTQGGILSTWGTKLRESIVFVVEEEISDADASQPILNTNMRVQTLKDVQGDVRVLVVPAVKPSSASAHVSDGLMPALSVADQLLEERQWIIVVHDDTYLFLPYLCQFWLKDLRPQNGANYFGRPSSDGTPSRFVPSGSGIIMSTSLINRIKPNLVQCHRTQTPAATRVDIALRNCIDKLAAPDVIEVFPGLEGMQTTSVMDVFREAPSLASSQDVALSFHPASSEDMQRLWKIESSQQRGDLLTYQEIWMEFARS